MTNPLRAVIDILDPTGRLHNAVTITPELFDGDTTPDALAAFEVYLSVATNFDATLEQAEQDAFTAGWDAATKLARA